MPSYNELTQGQRANVAGKVCERTLEPMFEEYDFDIFKWSDWKKHKLSLDDCGKVVIKGYPFTSIYGHNGRTEYLIVNNDRGVVARVEVKSQKKAGSKDECLPYLYLNCLEAYPEEHIILLLLGDGFKDGAKPWVHAAVSEQRYARDGFSKQIDVFDNVDDFIHYFQEELS